MAVEKYGALRTHSAISLFIQNPEILPCLFSLGGKSIPQSLEEVARVGTDCPKIHLGDAISIENCTIPIHGNGTGPHCAQ